MVGTDHPEYQGKNWLNVLDWVRHKPPRPDHQITCHKLSYQTQDGHNWFIANQDGHRQTCIARFAYSFWQTEEIKEVELTDWRYDLAMAEIYEQLLEVNHERHLGLKISASKEVTNHEDKHGWMQENYRTKVIIDPGPQTGRIIFEPPWVSRRLQLLREWSHEQEQREQIFPGNA